MKIYRVTYTVQCESVWFEDDENLEERLRASMYDEDTQLLEVEDEVHAQNFVVVKATVTQEEEDEV